MKKIDILITTLLGRKFNYNFGAVLQALALQEFLKKHRYSSEVLDFHPIIPRKPILKRIKSLFLKKHRVKKILVYAKKKLIDIRNRRINEMISNLNQIRVAKFIEFKGKYIRFTTHTYHSYEQVFSDLQRFHEKYKLFLAGSDQVWNKQFNSIDSLKVYLLRFARYSVKLSYASSVSSTIPEELSNLYKESLSDFYRISVREKGSAEEIAKVIGFEPTVVVDPVLLLNEKDWLSYLQPLLRDINSDFIFVYDLYRSEDIIPIVEKIASEFGIKYVNHAPTVPVQKQKYKNLLFNFYTQGPGEFLWLVKNSKFVITSSFHGTVFAIIFGKPFYSILWHKKEKIRQNDRIIDLLTKLGLEERAFVDPREILKRGLDYDIDWEQVHRRLGEIRKESADWLLRTVSEAMQQGPKLKRLQNVSLVRNCAGCFACYSVCPQKAIEMVFDKEGFYMPKLQENLCTDCGLCVSVCPAINLPKNDNYRRPKTYVAWSTNESTRLASSSGGIYPELAKMIIKKGGVVFAVGWGKDWLPLYKKIESIEEIPSTVGSKYIQSNVGTIYHEIIGFAKEGRKVLFVGTPCQVAGLKNVINKFLKKEEKQNVFFVDLVCHGVSSSLVFKKYLNETFDIENISEINFRSKDTGWSKYSFKVVKKNGSIISERFDKNSFFYGYLKNLYLRQSCYECPFSTLPRQGDLTLGDFWGVPEKYKDEKGVSVILVNNDKGLKALNELLEEKNIFAEEVPFEVAVKSNPRIFSGYMEIPDEREKILSEFTTKSWRYLEKKYIKPPRGVRSFIRRGLRFSRRLLRKFLKR